MDNCTILSHNEDMVTRMSPQMRTKMLQASLLMLFNAILMGVVVVIGTYTPRYRRHPVIGVATALFLPIVSIIVTTIDSVHGLIETVLKNVECYDQTHLSLVFAWTGVVVAIGISASAVVAGDAREGRNIDPPILLLVKASWSAYLTFSTLICKKETFYMPPQIPLVQLFAIMIAKLLFKYTAFYMARRSFALGRSPRLIAGYMDQLRQRQQRPVQDEHTSPPTPPPPALIVMGEDRVQVEEQPHGYSLLKQMPDRLQGDGDGDTTTTTNLVTLDRVWGIDEELDNILQKTSTTRPRDLCLSFALFKLLRCRFAKYTVFEAGFIQTSTFFRETLLLGDDYERVFGVIRDELSFINDYYFSSMPIYYSHPLLPAFGIMLSLWSIGYCSWLVVDITQGGLLSYAHRRGQINCWLELTTQHCGSDTGGVEADDGFPVLLGFGSLYYDIVPLYLAIAVLVLAEAREIVSYICSNWTKLALIGHHINQPCWQRPRVVQKCICSLLKYCRCRLVNSWDDKMKQCSVLVLCRRNSTPLLPRRLLRFLDRGKKKKVGVPSTVKAAIFETLKVKGESFTTEQGIGPPSSPVPFSQYGCGGKQPGYTILVWHIATSVFEVNQSRAINAASRQLPQPFESDHKAVATHLSRYCTYLVSSRPELLPDDAEWCRKLYDEVKKDADRILVKVRGGDDQLIRVLSADSNHDEVLRNGTRLGEELAAEDSSMRKGWEKLARFWVEMILYVAPSENLDAHVEAISHGGELITLLWAMLAHAGITSRRLDAAAGGGVEAAEVQRIKEEGYANSTCAISLC